MNTLNELLLVQPMSGPGPSFPMKVMTEAESRGLDTENPWHFRDGKWGGFGPQLWFTFKEFGNNVFEADRIKLVWARVWDDSLAAWRQPTDRELSVKFPYGPPKPIGNFNKWVFPVIRGL